MIGRKNLLLNPHTRICSKHFVNAVGRYLYLSEVPSLFLPRTSISWNKSWRKPPRDRSIFLSDLDQDELVMVQAFEAEDLEEDDEGQIKDMATQTEMNKEQVEELLTLQKKVATLEKQLEKANSMTMLQLSNIKDDETKVTFYSGFPSFSTLKACYDFLGTSVDLIPRNKRIVTLKRGQRTSVFVKDFCHHLRIFS